MSGGQKEPSATADISRRKGAARGVVTAAELASHYLIEPFGMPNSPFTLCTRWRD
jgi:hypothetical protein